MDEFTRNFPDWPSFSGNSRCRIRRQMVTDYEDSKMRRKRSPKRLERLCRQGDPWISAEEYLRRVPRENLFRRLQTAHPSELRGNIVHFTDKEAMNVGSARRPGKWMHHQLEPDAFTEMP